MSPALARGNLGIGWCSCVSDEWLIYSYKFIDEIIDIVIALALVVPQLLLKQLSDVVEHLFVSFVFREVLFVVLYQLLYLLVQLLLGNLLAVLKLHILRGSLRVVVLALVVLHELLYILASLRIIRASEIVNINI